MEEGTDKKEESGNVIREEIFSKAVRAGKRTYFFDVKATRKNDYYLTITESKKRYNKDGRFYYEKHKVFLYKEDFDKFSDNLAEVIEFIKNSDHKVDESVKEPAADKEKETASSEVTADEFTNVEFEDLETTSKK
jgi:hypothetical protein